MAGLLEMGSQVNRQSQLSRSALRESFADEWQPTYSPIFSLIISSVSHGAPSNFRGSFFLFTSISWGSISPTPQRILSCS